MKPTIAAMAMAGLLAPAAAFAQAKEAERGMQVFQQQKCTLCHSIAGKGNKKGALDEVGSKLGEAEIRQWITDPEGMTAKTTPPPTRKPPMKKKEIGAADVNALVAYLTTLKKQ